MDKIIERIQKLLALAGNNPNENEASVAAAKAQELMEEYNISELHLNRKSGHSAARSDVKKSGGLYQWQRKLWEEVSKLHFCVYWSIKGLQKGAKYEHRILGSKVNVLSAELMANYLQDTVERLARERVNNQGALYFTKDSIAYREGLADRLTDRLRTLRWEKERDARAAKAAAGTANALTILDVADAERDANDDYIHGEGYSARRRAQQAEWAARYAKMEADKKAWREANPELAAAQDAAEKAAQEKWDREQERKARARERRREQSGYYYREPKDNKRSYSYYDGYRDGNNISLDKQVDGQKNRIAGR
jgi:hypothetical protein